ncbi:MAG: thioredoxin domain-containing protein [Armatimonadota bacterium]|nr:MAG: thioredoxin domain-containing protein [Armatimonadota bacterium]
MNHTNRLINEKSPYLLQHARNPVDWYPWGAEAFERAKRADKPIFLSVGYSTCHWCHVMERESFESEETAAVLNEHCVSVKVDREERPDIDQVYMTAVQQLTGRGGWPMSMFLLPDGWPFVGGTYFTPNRFRHFISQIAEVYRSRRADAERAAAETVAAVEQSVQPPGAEASPLDRALVSRAVDALRQQFDEEHGGFGAAPKFPPHGALPLLFQEYRRTGDDDLLRMATRTLDAMAMGGIHDHLGGGFHRYSADAEWLLPHFEKMLYDNALLSKAYVEAYTLTQDTSYRNAAEDVYAWVAREMTHSQGGFHSALDADTEGEEGKFYVWRKQEIQDVLGREDGELFCRAYDIRDEGNYHDEVTRRRTGANIIHLAKEPSALADEIGLDAPTLNDRLCRAREKLLAVRDGRARPHLDDKIITSWNGLMIASLAYARRELEDTRYRDAAESAAEFILGQLAENGRLLRRWREGEARYDGFLDDYAYLCHGLLELSEATGSDEWLDYAVKLMDRVLAEFWDDAAGGFHYTSRTHEPLFTRPKEMFDHPLPSSNAIAAQVLLRLAALTGNNRYLDAAERTLRALSGWMAFAPQATESLVMAAEVWLEAQERGG